MSIKKQKSVKYPGSADVYEPYDVGAARFDETQTLSEAQKSLARENMGVNALLNTKANIDGYYETLAAGSSDNLVDRKGNGTAQSFMYRTAHGVGSIADDGNGIIQSIHGKTIVWNQLVQNGNFESTSGWEINNRLSNLSINNNIASFTSIEDFAQYLHCPLTFRKSHKYYTKCEINPTADVKVQINPINAITSVPTIVEPTVATAGVWTTVEGVGTIPPDADGDFTRLSIVLYQDSLPVGESAQVRRVMCFDLTAMFGSGNEPSTVAEFKAMFPLGYYAYNAGELLSYNGTGIKTVGFNQWDEEWESGTIDGTGNNVSDNTKIRSKNYITVFPNTNYYCNSTKTTGVRYYDINKVIISTANITNTSFTTPNNCYYLRFTVFDTTYNHDISINLSWSGYRNGEYEPYWTRTRNLPISTYFPNGMRSAGTVYDELTPSKAITRIGAVDLGTLDWIYAATPVETPYFYLSLSGIKPSTDNIMCTVLTPRRSLSTDRSIYVTNNGTTLIATYRSLTSAAAFKAAMSGVYLFYELATPTEATISPALNLDYRVSDFGTEESLPANDDEPTTAPFNGIIKYSEDFTREMVNLAKNYIGKPSWDTFVSSMSSIGYTITTTWNNTDQKYNISVVYNRPEKLVSAPATPTSTGVKGNYALDSNYLYCCTDTNTWKKLSFNNNKVYSVRFSGSAAAGTREDDAVGMVANVAVGSATVQNDFDSVPFYNRPICCCTWDTTAHRWRVNAYKGEPGFAWDGSNGELMYECTPCAYSNNTDLNTYVSVTGTPTAGYTLFEIFPDWNTKIYLPVFNMGYVNSKPTSRAGVFPTSDSLNGFMTKARAFDAKAHTETMAALFYETCLQYVEFATKDQQSIMRGAASLSYNAADTTIASVTSDTVFTMATGKASKFVAGQTVCIGSAQNGTQRTTSVKIASISGDVITLATAVSNLAAGDFLSSRMYECGAAATVVTNASSGSPVSNTSGYYPCIWRGKENPWANGHSTICDVLIKRTGSEGAYTYKMHYLPDPTLYSSGTITSDYIECNFNLATADGYGKVISSDSRYPFIFCDSAVGGTSTTYVSAYYYYPRAEVCALRFGGFFNHGRHCGSYFHCSYAPSSSDINFAARLFVLPY